MTRRTLLLVTLFLVFVGLPRSLGILTDWLWFSDLGYEGVYRTRLLSQTALFFLGGAVFVGLVIGSVGLAGRISSRALGALELPGSAQVRAMEGSFRRVVTIGTAFLGLIMAAGLSGGWLDILRFFNHVSFEAADPLFNRDISFFVFTLPVYRMLQGWLLSAVIMTLLATVAVYFFRTVLPQMPGARGEEQDGGQPGIRLFLTSPIRAHLFGFGAAIFVLLAWGHRLSIYELVYSPGGAAFGAGYADKIGRAHV